MNNLTSGALALAAGAVCVAIMSFAQEALIGGVGAAAQQTVSATTLQPVSSFDRIANRDERAVALFEEAGKVINSPRCMNCHPATERPTQGERMRPHEPLVVRGNGGNGAPGMVCTTCHRAENYDAAGMPGHPKWHLAPAEMAWQGKSLGQICEQIKDRKRNGDMDIAALVKHMAEDSLVGWGWTPGAGRTPAPGTQKEFGALFQAWADAGAACPKG